MAKRQGRLRIGDLMQRAVRMHQAGNLEDAIEIYGKVLEKVPAHPDALHYLGIAYHQSGDSATAVEKIEASIQAAPDRADFLGR
ncbi:MAG: tetratricopeptide repeat protein, partial [Alphaproteobacteria bacterium]